MEKRGGDLSRILCVIDGMTDPHFQVERYGHLASMGSMRYVDTCGGFPPETLHCVLRLLGVTDLPVHLRGYVEALGAGIPVRPDDLLLLYHALLCPGKGRGSCIYLLPAGRLSGTAGISPHGAYCE